MEKNVEEAERKLLKELREIYVRYSIATGWLNSEELMQLSKEIRDKIKNEK